MSLTKFVGVIENGQIRFAENIKLPETGLVYIVLPESETKKEKRVYDPGPETGEVPESLSVRSPRLVSPDQAERLKKRIIRVRKND